MSSKQPIELSEMFHKLGLKYGVAKKYLKFMLAVEWLDAVDANGQSAFRGKHFFQGYAQDISKMQVGLYHFKLSDYQYRITTQGSEVLQAYSKFPHMATEGFVKTRSTMKAAQQLQWIEPPIRKHRR